MVGHSLDAPQDRRVDFEDVRQYRISGDIPQRYLTREIEQFLRDHAAQQMVMEW